MFSFLKNLKTKNPKTTEDVEAEESNESDLIGDRPVSQLSNKFETLMNFLKSSGTGVFAMPLAFNETGTVTGIFATIFVAIICTHCIFVLVGCERKLCQKENKTSMSFSEVAESSCAHGPKFLKSWGKGLKHFSSSIISLTYFGTCSVYTVIVAENFEQIIHFYFGVKGDIRFYIAAIWIPCVLLCWIPHLKQLAPLSTVANLMCLIAIFITFYYCFMDMPSMSSRPLHKTFADLPTFFGITIFAMETIGVVLPLQKQMKKPEQMVGIFGVLNQGMAVITLLYGSLGLAGFIKFDEVKDSITLNLPIGELPAQAVKLFIAIATFCTISLQFYVLLEIIWNAVEKKFIRRKTLFNYILRTLLVSAIVSLAIIVPTIGPFVSLIGTFCFSIVGLLLPVFMELTMGWEQGYGKFNWKAWKNIFIAIFGIVAMLFGTKEAIQDIVKHYNHMKHE